MTQTPQVADYVEGVLLSGLTTSSSDTLTIRATPGERPTWKNDNSTVLFANQDGVNTYGALRIAIPYVTVQGITFTGTKHHGIQTSVNYITIRNCIFRDLTIEGFLGNYNHSSHGIYNYGSYHEFYNNTFYNVIYGMGSATPGSYTARNNIFCINHINIINKEN